MQLNSVVKIKCGDTGITNVASGCTITACGDDSKLFVTINTNESPFDLPIAGTAKVCNFILEHPYSSDNIRVDVRSYNHAAGAIEMRGEGENGNGFELNTYNQLPPDAVLIYVIDIVELIDLPQ